MRAQAREEEIQATRAELRGRAGTRVRGVEWEGEQQAQRAVGRRMRARVIGRELAGGSRERGARTTEECERCE